MNVRLLGTGSPIPNTTRAGTALLVTIGEERLLIDCGPSAVSRLLEESIDIAQIERLFFTHQHVDHNADFFNFVIGSWTMGREQLTIYGPAGTDRLLEALYSIYEEDLEYREQLKYPVGGIRDIEYVETTDEFAVETPRWKATALRVDHSIETYAYRFTDRKTGAAMVFSGDTSPLSELPSFAADADLLIQDACVGPVRTETPDEEVIWERLTEPQTPGRREKLRETHCTAAEAGELAADANVDHLVLTHLLPYRDTDQMRAAAVAAFAGPVTVAEDGLEFEL